MPIPAEFAAIGPYYTVDILDRLPDDGNRYEVVHGELLVTPAPRALHQEVVGRLYEGLRGSCEAIRLGMPSPHPRTSVGIAPRGCSRTSSWCR